MKAGLLKRMTLVLFLLAPAAGSTQNAATRPETEERLKAVQQEISEIQQSLEESRTTFSREQEQIRALDLEIQQNSRQMRELKASTKSQNSKLEKLIAEQEEFLHQLAGRLSQLEAQILAAWQMSRESRLKLVLNQDSPARTNRLLAYYEYLSRAQADQIGELKEVLAGLDVMRAGIDEEIRRLETITSQLELARQALNIRRTERSGLLQALESLISSDQEKLAELERNRADLETLLANLDNALADIPADLGENIHPGSRKGNLPMPIRGRVLKGFGQPRGAGLDWQGWLLEAGTGAEIRAIAYGRVAYADWLRGYGLLIIIDHGEGFMSLYGNNESLLFGVGDWVQAGTVIATVGSNPGESQGLYFELRNEGRAVDPAVWVSRR